MTRYETPKDVEELRALIFRLWSKAQEGPDYDKSEWLALQSGFCLLLGVTPPPPGMAEPKPWGVNGECR